MGAIVRTSDWDGKFCVGARRDGHWHWRWRWLKTVGPSVGSSLRSGVRAIPWVAPPRRRVLCRWTDRQEAGSVSGDTRYGSGRRMRQITSSPLVLGFGLASFQRSRVPERPRGLAQRVTEANEKLASWTEAGSDPGTKVQARSKVGRERPATRGRGRPTAAAEGETSHVNPVHGVPRRHQADPLASDSFSPRRQTKVLSFLSTSPSCLQLSAL